MKITIAKDAGYCFGVRDAVNLAYKSAEENGEIYMLGDIVHNEQVVSDLAGTGTKVVDNLNGIPNDKPVLFRAHGTETKVWEDALGKGLDIIDATCPLVQEIHDEVRKLAKDGRQIIIIGDHGHDEVVGIMSHAKNSVVIASPKEAHALNKMKRAGVVSQSTQSIENVQEIINILMTKVFDLHFINTICFPTKQNQEQIKTLASENDVMVIIGSFTSANSKRLTLLSLEINKNTYQVNSADEIDPSWFDQGEKVGISAGASTPDYLIDQVYQKIKQLSPELEEVYE
ncbi:MAG: 4-hydroxy-3-methylbut-2-enyl diphosphate reductase [Candidatus Marinimicrobia bacterium]|nr:4-hydroxy-3-methylbut-2-enyl diphosphate reductase [Candidatus Neomarinimicrobiota bacterium]MDP7059814.1 4-hydroxy-3-methylbut-2-enyl diphosphate reductase [Candidatus Neomarinimicrobiota bacterium]